MSDAERPDGPAADSSGGSQKAALPVVLVAAGVALLLVVGIAIAALTRGDNQQATDPGSSGSAATGSNPSDAVRGYLEALAADDADKAIGFLDTAPADRTLLTREVLAVSAKKAPLTAVDVPEVTAEAAPVTARYALGKQAVSEDYSVIKSGGSWKITRGVTELNLGTQRNPALPLLVNGVEVTTDTVALFPGHYTFTTRSKWVSYGDQPTLTLTSPSDDTVPRLAPTLTADAKAAFVRATRKALGKCLDQRKLAPAGCPNRLQTRRDQKVDEDTIRWTLTNDPFKRVRVTLNPTDPTVAEATLSPRYNFRAEGTQDGRRATFDGPPTGLSSFRSTGDLSGQTIQVRLSTP